ncbi:hypothetical protein ACP6H1_26040 [Vibrio harveyi]|uniref:hypothetical protein n=1 Tax=Vibrio harveyi TaxID=669 RepID=UPI002B3D87F5|nr:hypothetical protein [Vibrio alginolyticus]EME3939240.1 hypothetical protein [Vibrio alginolyticus]HEQ3590809.1 hypothetical protein [Vibrio harveyi]HEQ3598140.1 hypothetical protein [Vibrio harveyi]HEQ3606675.1 hypothetical protein [Vibrio harveyi]
MNKNVNKISVTYDPLRDGLIIPEVDPSTIRIERSYERASGKPKVLTSVQGLSDFAAFDVDTMLLEEYDYIISVDTNSREYNGQKISICTCYQVPGRASQYTVTDGVPFVHLGSFIIVNPQPNLNPELIGWHLVITNFLQLPFDTGKEMLAIIVDSEKDSLPDFNKRIKPYFNSSYLHHQVKLCYASDKDKDTLAGQMLKMCHNMSNQIFRQIQSEKAVLPKLTSGYDFCDGFVQIESINA